MTNEKRYINKSVEDLVEALSQDAQAGSQRHEEIKGALSNALTERLVHSIDEHSKSSDRLSNRVLALNIILGAFTIIGTILSIFALIQ